MDFNQALAQRVGRSVEIYQATQMLSGTLTAVGNGVLQLQTTASAYTATAPVTVPVSRIEYIRIMT